MRRGTPSNIIFSPPEIKPVLERMSYLAGMSIREVAEMAFRIIREVEDPNRGDGPEYQFWGGVDLEDVPEPRANCNIREAWEMAQRHSTKVKELLEDNPSLLTLLVCQRNIMLWCRFWAVRFPLAEWRDKFAGELEAAELDIAKVQRRFGICQ
jgi:hypothetical protein